MSFFKQKNLDVRSEPVFMDLESAQQLVFDELEIVNCDEKFLNLIAISSVNPDENEVWVFGMYSWDLLREVVKNINLLSRLDDYIHAKHLEHDDSASCKLKVIQNDFKAELASLAGEKIAA